MTSYLVGPAEVAAILGISRQRVAQLATSAPDFPAPEADLAAGRIWSRSAIERWAADHPERGARTPTPRTPPAGTWPRCVHRIMDIAGAQSRLLNHSWVGTDHLLLALIHPECPGRAGAVLRTFGLRLDDVRDAYVASMGDPHQPHGRGHTVPPATHVVLERAKSKALEMRDDEVTSEHVLLALTERWEQCPLTAMLAALGLDADEVRLRVMAVTESGGLAEEQDWPKVPLGPWPDLGPSRDEVELATSPAGHDPWRRRSWGSVIFTDARGSAVLHGRAVRQYFIDRDGYPVLTTDGRPVHVLLDDAGEALRDEDGRGILGPVEIPPGCVVRASPRARG